MKLVTGTIVDEMMDLAINAKLNNLRIRYYELTKAEWDEYMKLNNKTTRNAVYTEFPPGFRGVCGGIPIKVVD